MAVVLPVRSVVNCSLGVAEGDGDILSGFVRNRRVFEYHP